MDNKQQLDFEKIGKDIEQAVNEQLSKLKKETKTAKIKASSTVSNQTTSVPNLGSII